MTFKISKMESNIFVHIKPDKENFKISPASIISRAF